MKKFVVSMGVAASLALAFSPATAWAKSVHHPKPRVTLAKAVPWQLPSTGGAVTVHGKVVHGQRCWLKVVRSDGIVVQRPKPRRCAPTYSARVVFGPNRSKSAVNVKLQVRDLGASGTFYVHLAASPPARKLVAPVVTSPAPSPTTSPPSPSPTVTVPLVTVSPAPPTIITPTPVPSTTTTTTTIAVRANIDPNYTLPSTPQAPPLPVTFAYSATSGSTVPDGTLTFDIYVHGSETSVAGCAANVGGAITSATCTATIPAWGNYDLVTTYATNSPNVIPTAQTDTVDIQPPALPAVAETEAWGTSGVTASPAIAATVNTALTADAVTLTDPNFEGATAVTLTDSNGNECGAIVAGTTASCTMPSSGTPSSFKIAYPGGTSQVLTETASPWGVSEPQQVTISWPARTVTVSSPTVTIPTVTHVTDTISFIDAYGPWYDGAAPAPCGVPANYECVALGTQGLPADGTVTLSTTLNTENVLTAQKGTTALSCTVDLSVSTVCFAALPYATEALSTVPWTVTASWSGYSTGSYNVTDYSAPPVTYAMVPAGGASIGPVTSNPTGTWWDSAGNPAS